MTGPVDRPGVIVLPPLVFLAALATGWVLHLVRPVALPIPPAARWTGAALGLGGLALGAAGRVALARAGTEVNPMKPATAVVTTGAYRLSRNPMYVGMTFVFLGITLATRSGWLMTLLPAIAALIHWGVVRREERYLAGKFGAEYQAYRARVRRYL